MKLAIATPGWSATVLAPVFGALSSLTAPNVAAAARPEVLYPAPPLHRSNPLTLLDDQIDNLGRTFNGDIGIAVQDVDTGELVEFDGRSYFPQQSVSKFWVALTALNAQDEGRKDLQTAVILKASDLTLFHQPIAAEIRAAGSYRTTLDRLLTRALQQSDNTCNDYVLRAVGGPDAVHAFLAAKNIEGIRFGPGERQMQSRIAALTWRPEYSRGNAFYQARSNVPLTRRQAAFDAYIANPVDGARPVAIVGALSRLQRGELLSPTSTARLLEIMSHSRTGPKRLKGGLSEGWSLAHKTGTGQQLGAVQTGYNDIGIMTSPSGRTYAVAVMIRRTSAPIWSRMLVMQNVVQAVIDYDAMKPQRLLPGESVTAARK
ncbi:serine hydrolase [Novosphingobium album (ex Liu et al. 2023)]|uniref:beta-lactamase n=1 Tax=Novosphingobium album (ex Liu et al. 2023) TaxID=3031130 RepID=A0ABT5WXQ6_9SPHN|nr:serine hydrolase [Novosphingobium album (ex Liu et al. 2023)]MDE8654693.1 serine hydrolase [Novosphingobium album (ex Liu et al. 2023)]